MACTAVFLGFLDTTITNLAIPSVASEFAITPATVTWLATAYAIPFAALLAPGGALADAVGRTRLFRRGVALFTLSSFILAIAPTFATVLAARAIQGVGAALMTPASLALILAEVPARRRRAAIGVWSASGALAAAVGPALGGMIVDVADWRAVFCLNLPFGLWALLAARPLRKDDVTSPRWPDPIGSVLLALGVGALVYGLTEGTEQGWTSPLVISGFLLTLSTGVWAVWRAATHPRPALRMDLLRDRSFTLSAGLSMAYGMALFTMMLIGVMLLVGLWGFTTLKAGLAMTPAAAVTALVGIGATRAPSTFQPRWLVGGGGLILAGVATYLAVAISPTPRLWSLWIPVGVLMGVAIGLITVGISTAGTLAAPPQHFAAATGLLMAGRQLGGAVGIAVLAAIISEIDSGSPELPYVAVYGFVATMALAVAVGGFFLCPQSSTDAETARPVSTAGAIR